MNIPLPDVRMKHSFQAFAVENSLIKTIVDNIKLIPLYEQLKNDIEITEHVCNLVENIIINNKSSKPIDKKQLVIKIMAQLFNLNSEADRKIIDQQIDYLINNKMIKKISLGSKILKSVKSYFLNTLS
jgi:hypothetical protein